LSTVPHRLFLFSPISHFPRRFFFFSHTSVLTGPSRVLCRCVYSSLFLVPLPFDFRRVHFFRSLFPISPRDPTFRAPAWSSAAPNARRVSEVRTSPVACPPPSCVSRPDAPATPFSFCVSLVEVFAPHPRPREVGTTPCGPASPVPPVPSSFHVITLPYVLTFDPLFLRARHGSPRVFLCGERESSETCRLLFPE